jgi:putative nucleotidyltransferase with HDIG domain
VSQESKEKMAISQVNQQKVMELTSILAKVKDLPPLPGVVMKAIEMILNPDASIRNLHTVISQDQALSAKILKIVNSAMYSLRSEVSTVSHAISILGINTLKSVLMAASIDNIFQSAKDLGKKLMSDHSWGTALASRAIAQRVRYENPEEALVCGLMHDIGKPILMQNFGQRYYEIISEVYRGSSTFHQLEIQHLGFSHAEVGMLLARKWNFPPQLAEAVGYHHDPLEAPNHKQLACIVNMGNLFMIRLGIGFEKNANLVLEDQPAAKDLRLGSAAVAAVASTLTEAIEATSALRN